MTRFTNEDFEFTVPDQWIERSVVTFSAPPVMGKLPANFAIAYDVMPAEEELLKYANRQVDSLRAMLKDWQMIQQSATRISGREADQGASTEGGMHVRKRYTILNAN